MESPMVRGYLVLGALSFVETRFGRNARDQVLGGLAPRLPADADSLTPGTWCPRECLVDVMRSIAASAGDRPDDALAACGATLAATACDTFLKVVLGLMTAELFSKKIPKLWEIDYRSSGDLKVDLGRLSESRVQVVAGGVAGFDHFGPLYAGWLYECLRRSGGTRSRVAPTTIGPDSVAWQLDWS
jgi:hypothetical protein